MKRTFLLAIGALFLFSPHMARAQNRDLELFAANYGVSFGQQFLGKVIQGKNVLGSFIKTFYEAVPSATLQYAGMRLVGSDWRYALPARLLTQKGTQIQRRSILGQPIFSRELLTSWELNYLWLNLRVRDGKPLLPRLNVGTVWSTFRFDHTETQWGASLFTGAVVLTGTREQIGFGLDPETHETVYFTARTDNNVILIRDIKSYPLIFAHEFVHGQQRIRGQPFFDVLLHQDASQRRPLPFLRLDLGGVSSETITIVHRFLFNPSYWYRFKEWEAGVYSSTLR